MITIIIIIITVLVCVYGFGKYLTSRPLPAFRLYRDICWHRTETELIKSDYSEVLDRKRIRIQKRADSIFFFPILSFLFFKGEIIKFWKLKIIINLF